ncbi:MAG: NAD(P)/FAD-dependent oxidoreductase [Promethearchaeota archaeon]
MDYDIIVIGAGVSGATFASKISKYAKILVLEAKKEKDMLVNTNIFPEHNRPFFNEISWSDKDVFPSIHEKMRYLGIKNEAIVNSKEFGAPLGNITYQEILVKKLLQNCENNGGIVKFNEKCTKISRTINHIEVITNKGQLYRGKMLVLATGSHSFELQESLGFETPDKYMGVFTHLYGDETHISDNLGVNYIFHINTNISKNGPLYFNKGVERVAMGFLGINETPSDLVSKLNKILTNYKKIQPYINGLRRDSKPSVCYISKHPIKKFSQDRVLVLGEASGLITAFFYEGVGTGIISADIAAKTLKPLLEQGSNRFRSQDLSKYDLEIKRVLLKNYFRNGNASEYIFYNATSYMKLLWDLYVDLVRTSKTLRKYIWEAYRTHELEHYDIKRDRWIGEKLYAKLPVLSKIVLGPRFFKALFK